MRPRSCRSCNAAKAKCSFDLRCSRCVAKGLDCVYDRRAKRNPGLGGSSGHAVSGTTPIRNLSEPLTEDFGLDLLGDLPLSPRSLQQFDDFLAKDFGRSATFDADEVALSAAAHNVTRHSKQGWSLPADPTTIHENALNKVSYLHQLQAPCTSVIHSSRLIHETFPPFIHPHWAPLSMPESLAICMRIAQMFATRTPEITPFIWRTILAEQRRIVEKVSVRNDHI